MAVSLTRLRLTLFDRLIMLIGVLGLIGILLLAMWFFTILDQRRVENGRPLENTTWAAYQLVFEYHRLRETALSAQIARSEITNDDLLFRLDILYSRAVTVQSGTIGEILLSDPDLLAGFRAFEAALVELDDLAARSAAQTPAELAAAMLPVVEGIDQPVRMIGLRAHHLGSELQAMTRKSLDTGLWWLGVLMAFSLAVLAVFAGMALFQTLRLRRVHNDREKATQMATVAREQAERANQAKSRLLANTSHELRTPLNAILGFSDIIRSSAFGPVGVPKYRSYADDIHYSALHLLDLINDLLDLSRIEAGKMELDETRVDVLVLAEQSAHLIKEMAERFGVVIAVEKATPSAVLWADRRMIRQMLQNLLSNAVKFNRSGGLVDLCVRRNPDQGDLEIVVADTGVGIPEGELAHLIEPFQQASNTRNNPERGSGLGLSIVRRLIEAHGGEMALTSIVNKGTTIVLSFPASRVLDRTTPDASGGTGSGPGEDPGHPRVAAQ